MADLIDRQAAIDEWKNDFKGYINALNMPKDDYDGIMKYIDELPSVQPEIIRCKDCKHFAGEGMYCSCDIIVQFDHFYCYHAERRQDV